MRPFSFGRIILLALAAIFLYSCSDKKETFATEPLTDYLPLEPGKYITYRVDSLIFTDFGHKIDTHRYQIKHVVDAEITDNLGRPSFRVFTYIRDSAGIGDWQNNSTYMITPLRDRIEVIEDNLRFIKMHAPLRDGYSWRGNSYLHSDAYKPLGYEFSNDYSLKAWEYYYDFSSTNFTYRDQTYTDLYCIQQNDLQDNDVLPVYDTAAIYASASIGEEKYAKNIGLAFRKYILWEYQRNLSNTDPKYTGFGITMWMVDHN
jgi:hypothetical protein